MSEFYFSYFGNKRTEINYIIDYFNLIDENKLWVEPFGGTCYNAYYLWKNQMIKPENIFISDIDDQLVYFCNNFYKDKENIIEQTKKFNVNLNKKDHRNLWNQGLDIDDPEFMIKFLSKRSFKGKYNGLIFEEKEKNRYPKYKKILKTDYNDFFRQVKYNCIDFKEVLEKYKNNDQVFIYLDPPYVNSDCDDYDCNKNRKIEWEYLYNWCNECKCKFILVVNDNIFMRILFKDFFKKSYDKIYQTNKTKSIHNLYSNI
jgi:hypothetical protein